MYHPRLFGTHYNIGKHYGTILYKTGENLNSVIKLNESEIDFGKSCFPIYEKYLPEIMEEVRGLAEGLQQKYEDVAYWLINLYCNEEDYGCSVFAVKSGSKVFFGRNMDMFPQYKKTSESILYRIENKNIILGHSTAMISLEDGINNHGLCAALTFLLAKEIKPGINGGFIVRKILEDCKNVEEALALIKSLPISSTHNIVIADKTGAMAVIECNSEEMNVRYSSKYIAATNHFVSLEMNKYNNHLANWYFTNDRYNTIVSYLQKNEELTIEECKNLLSGKYGFVCQFPKNINFRTIWSSVYELTEKSCEICEGNPSTTKFKLDNRLTWAIKKGKRASL